MFSFWLSSSRVLFMSISQNSIVYSMSIRSKQPPQILGYFCTVTWSGNLCVMCERYGRNTARYKCFRLPFNVFVTCTKYSIRCVTPLFNSSLKRNDRRWLMATAEKHSSSHRLHVHNLVGNLFDGRFHSDYISWVRVAWGCVYVCFKCSVAIKSSFVLLCHTPLLERMIGCEPADGLDDEPNMR